MVTHLASSSSSFSKRRLALLVAATFFGAGVSVTSHAATNESPYRVGPAAAALGGAGRAAVDPTESGWLNPASLVHAKTYHFAISRQLSNRPRGDGYRDFAVMLADGGIDKIAAGSFSYVQRSTLRGGPGAISAEQKDFQASLAAFAPGQRFSLGFTYRRLLHEQPGFDVTQDTYSVGLLAPLGKDWGIGIVGHDLAGGSSSAVPEAQLIPSIAMGVHGALMQILHLRGDIVRPIRDNSGGRNDVRLGLESWFRPDFAFRLGAAALETRDETWLTTGIGFKGPRLSFGYAFEKEMRQSDGTRHLFDLWLPL